MQQRQCSCLPRFCGTEAERKLQMKIRVGLCEYVMYVCSSDTTYAGDRALWMRWSEVMDGCNQWQQP